MEFLIINSNIVFKDCIKKKDILIRNGYISEIEDKINKNSCKNVIDGEGLFCMPGIFDMHVHLREPGFAQKETIKTGAKAAAAGGITSLACMANTSPVIDSPETLLFLKDKITKENINIYPIASITKNLEGKELVDFEKLKKYGAIGFSDDGVCVKNSSLMMNALKKAKKLDMPIMSHCEDLDITETATMNCFSSKEINDSSEIVMVARDAALCLYLNCPVHICHVSRAVSVDIIRHAKQMGAPITAETCPHYFFFTKKDNFKKDPNFKMNPPLGEESDRKAIENGLLENVIDCIATDHAPHELEVKKDFKTAANGIIGLQTLLSCVITHFYRTKKMSLIDITKLLSKNPAKILKFQGSGEIYKGGVADIILVDLNKKWEVKKEDFFSKSCNSPFIGKTLFSRVIYTFCKGQLVFYLK